MSQISNQKKNKNDPLKSPNDNNPVKLCHKNQHKPTEEKKPNTDKKLGHIMENPPKRQI